MKAIVYPALFLGLGLLAFGGLFWLFIGEALRRASTSTAGKIVQDRRSHIERRISAGSPAPVPERRSGHDRRRNIRV